MLRLLGLAVLLSLALRGTLADAAEGPGPVEPADGRPIVIGQSYTIRSARLGDERRVNVYLPDHYSERGKSFVVLVLLDGGEKEDFHHVTGLAQITAAYDNGREMIVVGVEGKDRRHDLTSASSVAADRKLLPTSGGADAYRRFLVDELKPWIAAHYRTDGHTALMGESLAGLFTAETLLKAPTSFDDYIIVSPSLWWDAGALSKQAADDLRRGGFSGRRAWVGFDDPAPPAAQAAKERSYQQVLESAFREVRPAGLVWKVSRPGEGHSAIYHPAALQAFRDLYGMPAGRAPG